MKATMTRADISPAGPLRTDLRTPDSSCVSSCTPTRAEELSGGGGFRLHKYIKRQLPIINFGNSPRSGGAPGNESRVPIRYGRV